MRYSGAKLFKGIGSMMLTLFGVLLIDAVVACILMLVLMGDKANGNYTPQHRIISCTLSIYILCLVTTAMYWYAKYQQTARAIGVLLGVLPMAWLLGKFLSRIVL
jgi:general stress protein CsbA